MTDGKCVPREWIVTDDPPSELGPGLVGLITTASTVWFVTREELDEFIAELNSHAAEVWTDR